MHQVCLLQNNPNYVFNRRLTVVRHVFAVPPNDPHSYCGHKSYQFPLVLNMANITVHFGCRPLGIHTSKR